MIPLCLLGRALNIFPLAAALNKADPLDKITPKEQVVMWHAGESVRVAKAFDQRKLALFSNDTSKRNLPPPPGLRGAIAFSISLHFPNNQEDPRHKLRDPVIDTTSMIILLSVFLLGGTTKPLLSKMDIGEGRVAVR